MRIDSNVLSSALPVDAQVEVIRATVTNLVPAGLTSAAHMQWAMECIGRGLGLPGKHAVLTLACAKVYADWIDLRTAPPPMQADPFTFLPTIVKHLSQVFGIQDGAVPDHAQTCAL